MNIDEMTIGELKELQKIFGAASKSSNGDSITAQVGEQVFVRTCSAGCWYGKLKEKSSTEVLLEGARRLRRYFCTKGVSMCGVAENGVIPDKSEVEEARSTDLCIPHIEIHTATAKAIESINNCQDLEQN